MVQTRVRRMSTDRQPTPDLALLRALLAHRWAALTFALVSIAGILAVVMVWPHSYAARSTLLLKLGRENLSVPALSQAPAQVMNMGLRKEDIVTEIEMLRSRHLLQRVIDQLGVATLMPGPERAPGLTGTLKWYLSGAVTGLLEGYRNATAALSLEPRLSREERLLQTLERALSAEQLAQSNMIQVSLRWRTRELATRILSNLIEGYLELHLSVFGQPGQRDFFSTQAELLAERIATGEAELEAFQSDHQVYAGDSQERILQQRHSDAKRALQGTRAEIAEVSTQMDDLRWRLNGHQNGGAETMRQYLPDAELGEHRKRLLDLDLERTRQRTKYLPDSEVIRNLDREIAAVKERLRDQEADLVARQIRSLETRLAALRGREHTQEAQLAGDQAELEAITRYGAELRRLQRQIQSDEGNLALYRTRAEEARIAEVLDLQRIVNVSVVQPVTASERPVAPRKVLILALGVLFSLALGAGLALLLDYLDSSIRSPEDCERVLGLPCLGTVREAR